MFEPSVAPRVFALPIGADFGRGVAEGLRARLAGQPPEAIARVRVFVNSSRMQRRIRAVLSETGAGFLPDIRIVTEIDRDLSMADVPPPVPPLRRRLELARLIARLVELQPDLAPQGAVYDLADSLAMLMAEMQGEGVSPKTLETLDLTDHSRHWERSLAFIRIVSRYFDPATAPDGEARRRIALDRLRDRWRDDPPRHPVIVAGSTGSRGTTAQFMRLVARLPQGAVILPGYDFDQPEPTWQALDEALTGEDHPQFRFRRLMSDLDLVPGGIRPWHDMPAPNPARNRLVSLALRPAPVTDHWMEEGPRLEGIDTATRDMTLIEAASPRAEALAIALRLRQAAEEGTVAALITPDRGLTRQVSAMLDRWGILPDDSAGQPLALSAPGRLLRQVAALFGRKTTIEALLALLKHPLAHGGPGRGDHLLRTRELELALRSRGAPYPDAAMIAVWADGQPEREAWADWLCGLLAAASAEGEEPAPLADHVVRHLALAERLAGGVAAGDAAGILWDGAAGQMARATADQLLREAPHGGAMDAFAYDQLFNGILRRLEVREPVLAHPRIMIWGTLEARVQGAELVILGGLNDGIWPALPPPDPWLNRRMRHDAGLLLPERQIGLAAHDFQQAIGAHEVWLTRAVRDAEAETVPSRWLNRLTNLMGGLAAGQPALAAMRVRGRVWLDRAAALETPGARVPPAPRPSPRPPVAARPGELAVTGIRTLIRDPYAIYARHVLGLRPLDPLRPLPDAAMRGTVLHKILEHFIRDRGDGTETGMADAKARLLAITDAVLADRVPWPTAQRIWRARLERAADWFLEREAGRQGTPRLIEKPGRIVIAPFGFTLTAKPDRIDLMPDGRVHVYDYKTGKPPTAKQQQAFDKQLLLEAAMAERGAFEVFGPVEVDGATYIGLGSAPVEEPIALPPGETDKAWDGLCALLAAFAGRGRGYTSRRAVAEERMEGDYDHLARYGEWEMSDPPVPEDVGPQDVAPDAAALPEERS